MPAETARDLATRFKALADPTRLAIVNQLAGAGEVCGLRPGARLRPLPADGQSPSETPARGGPGDIRTAWHLGVYPARPGGGRRAFRRAGARHGELTCDGSRQQERRGGEPDGGEHHGGHPRIGEGQQRADEDGAARACDAVEPLLHSHEQAEVAPPHRARRCRCPGAVSWHRWPRRRAGCTPRPAGARRRAGGAVLRARPGGLPRRARPGRAWRAARGRVAGDHRAGRSRAGRRSSRRRRAAVRRRA